MMALLFILVVTGLSMMISHYINPEPGWFEYYKGGIIGFFLSGVILYIINEKRRKKELKKDR
jgi:purine-cytosine permease-like protein